MTWSERYPTEREPVFPPEKLWACVFCGTVKTSPNGTGSDVVCCGEVGRVEEVEA